MKKLLPLLLVAALAACNREPAPDTAATPVVDEVEDTAPVATVALKSPLAEGVVFSFPHNVISDDVTTREGRERRTLRIETLGTDSPQAMRDVRAALKAAGFRAQLSEGAGKSGVTRLENGGLRADFTKKGYGGRVVVSTREVPEGKARHPDATAFVNITWLMPKPGSAAAAADATDDVDAG